MASTTAQPKDPEVEQAHQEPTGAGSLGMVNTLQTPEHIQLSAPRNRRESEECAVKRIRELESADPELRHAMETVESCRFCEDHHILERFGLPTHRTIRQYVLSGLH